MSKSKTSPFYMFLNKTQKGQNTVTVPAIDFPFHWTVILVVQQTWSRKTLLTCLTLFFDDDTLNIPTVLNPCSSRCLMHMSTMVGTLGMEGEGQRWSRSKPSRQDAKDNASNAEP